MLLIVKTTENLLSMMSMLFTYFTTICVGEFTFISGLPLYSVTTPVTQIFLLASPEGA